MMRKTEEVGSEECRAFLRRSVCPPSIRVIDHRATLQPSVRKAPPLSQNTLSRHPLLRRKRSQVGTLLQPALHKQELSLNCLGSDERDSVHLEKKHQSVFTIKHRLFNRK